MVVLITVVVALAGLALVGAVAAFLLLRNADPEGRRLVKRVVRLSFRSKLRLALALAKDRRVPRLLRGIPPALVLYLASPIDIIPDFIPVIGYADDVVVVAVGVGLLLRFTPPVVLEEHVARLEAPAAPASLPEAQSEPGE